MIYSLVSNLIIHEKRHLNPVNTFVNLLREHLPSKFSALFVCSDPGDNTFTDQHAADAKMAFEVEGMTFEKYAALGNRTANQAPSLIVEADLIFLAGGHVLTQNAFLNSVGMHGLLQSSDKLVIGSSAGPMNAAELVYAQPEEADEAISRDYQHFLTGLGIIQVQLIPHYQETKHHMLDGLYVFEDIIYPDSNGRCFYVICDGSFLYRNGTVEMIYGEAYRIKNGVLSQINAKNETYQFRR